MGHIVNPISFRIGSKGSGVSWTAKWFNALQRKFLSLNYVFNDYLIINYIFVFFKSLKKESRNVVFTTFSKKIQRKLQGSKFRKRVRFWHKTVLRQSLVVSHVKIVRVLDFLRIGIFFLDSTFINKLRYLYQRKTYFNFFNEGAFREKRHNTIRQFSYESQVLFRNRKRRRRNFLKRIFKHQDYRSLFRFFPRHFKFKNFKRSRFMWYRGVKGRFFRRSIFYRRIGRNSSQMRFNHDSFYSMFRNLVWYVIIFRKFFYKKRKFNSSIYNLFENFYFFKSNMLTYTNSVRFFNRRYHSGMKARLKIYIYNKFFNRLRYKLINLIKRRLFILSSVIKKFTDSVSKHLNSLFTNVSSSVRYVYSFRRYEYYSSLLNFFHNELSYLNSFFFDKFTVCNYLKRIDFRRFLKLRNWTKLFLVARWKRVVRFYLLRRYKRIKRRIKRRFFLTGSRVRLPKKETFFFDIFFRGKKIKKNFYKMMGITPVFNFKINYIKPLQSLFSEIVFRKSFYVFKRFFSYFSFFSYSLNVFSMFKTLFLIFVNKVDWFFNAYVRKFYFKLFMYSLFRLFSILLKLRRFTDFFSELKIINHSSGVLSVKYKYLLDVLVKLLICVQKHRLLFRFRRLKFFVLYKFRFQLFLMYSVIFKTSNIIQKDLCNKVHFSYFGLNQKSLTSKVIINYMCKLFRNRYSFSYILRYVLRDLRKYARYIAGFRIVCSGRPTKKQRAFHKIKSAGGTNSSSVFSVVDFSTDFVVLRFGVVNLKVWLARSKYFTPFFYKVGFDFYSKNSINNEILYG